MAQPSKRRRSRKARNQLWKNGFIAAAAGGGLLLLASAVGGKHPFVAAAVSMPAWWAMGFGALLMLLHLATKLVGKRRSAHSEATEPAHPVLRPQPAGVIQALIDQVERETFGPDTPSPSARPSPIPPDLSAGLDPFNPVVWPKGILTGLADQHFVDLCVALLAQSGFATRLAQQEHGKGMDIWLQEPECGKPAAIVLCHLATDGPLDVDSIRTLKKMISAHGLRWGACITLAEITTPAMALAANFDIHILEAHELQLLISRRSQEQQMLLLKVMQRPAQ